MRFLCLTAALLACASAQIYPSPSTRNATASALVYGYPLLAFSKLAGLLVPGFGVNNIFSLRALSGPSNTAVVKPNVDTLYSTAIFDLSQNDLSLTVPKVPDSEFALFSFYDPYGDNFANVGTGNFNQSGQYLIRLRGDRPYGVKPVISSNASRDQYVAYIDSPSTYGIFLARYLVNETNLNAVHNYQDGTLLNNATRNDTSADAPPLRSLNYQTSNSTSPAQNALNLLARLGPYCLPETQEEVTYVQAFLQTAGISNGSYTAPANIDLDAENRTALSTILAAVANTSNSVNLNNGWSTTNPEVSGNFNNGSNFAYRAAVASSGYLMLQAPTAVYPSWTNASASGSAFASQQMYLGPNESYLYTFSAKPPLQQAGFWSLTAYKDNYLIENPIDVYALGDRSHLTYPDGSAIYGANASSHDGVFQILIQAADHAPPSNWTSNWLPGPAGGGNFSALLRWYVAQDALLDGSYVYPVVTKQAAITASNGTSGGGAKPSATVPLVTSSGTSSSSATSSATASGAAASSGSSAAGAVDVGGICSTALTVVLSLLHLL